ncbi:MAG: aminotransferase [Micropepsaceae bacterium]
MTAAPPLPDNAFSRLGTTIFSVMSALAVEHNAVNLGQGFPDEDGPESIRQAAAKALLEGPNQYPPMPGLPVLRQALARHAKRHYGLDFDWQSEIVVTSGATEALTDCLLGLLTRGDEAILIDPAYDSYRPIIDAIGAKAVGVKLDEDGWKLPLAAIEAAVTAKTRLVLINSPHNPSGRVFSRAELEGLADIVKRHNLLLVCDEVYEHLTFDGVPHIPLITLPGMRERTVRVGSAGKIFSFTGWKIGWIMGPAALISPIMKAHQFVTFTTSPALQIGVAHGLDHEQDWYLDLPRQLAKRRDTLVAGLTAAGWRTMPCEGTYFVTADFRPLSNANDIDFARALTIDGGVTTIPLSVFYGSDAPKHFVRFAFCKKQSTIDAALARLAAAKAPA